MNWMSIVFFPETCWQVNNVYIEREKLNLVGNIFLSREMQNIKLKSNSITSRYMFQHANIKLLFLKAKVHPDR